MRPCSTTLFFWLKRLFLIYGITCDTFLSFFFLGEKLIKKVYEALRAGPKWEETLFLITYDEHGGFYDHVVPPHRGIPGDNEVRIGHLCVRFNSSVFFLYSVAITVIEEFMQSFFDHNFFVI